MFRKYDHLERLGHAATGGIDIGTVFVFPKLDGANASVWLEDGELAAGSRNTRLQGAGALQGFQEYVQQRGLCTTAWCRSTLGNSSRRIRIRLSTSSGSGHL